QALPADPGANGSKQPAIALAEAFAAANPAIQPANRREGQDGDPGTGHVVKNGVGIDQPRYQEPAEGKRQGEGLRQPVPPLIDDSQRKERPAEPAPRPGEPSGQHRERPDGDDERRDLDRGIEPRNPVAAVSASG